MTAPAPHDHGIDAADLVEIGELCGFLHDWITAEADTLAPALGRFTLGLFSLEEIAADLARSAWLLDPKETTDRIEGPK
jgi:hypothetical protein